MKEYDNIKMGAAKTVSGSPFAKMSTFWELPVFPEVIHMWKIKRKEKMMLGIVVGIVGIIVTVISIIVTVISIRHTSKKDWNQKATAALQSCGCFLLK